MFFDTHYAPLSGRMKEYDENLLDRITLLIQHIKRGVQYAIAVRKRAGQNHLPRRIDVSVEGSLGEGWFPDDLFAGDFS